MRWRVGFRKQIWLMLVPAALMIGCFQNCVGGFNSDSSLSLSSTGSSAVPATLAALSNNCSAIQDNLETTAIRPLSSIEYVNTVNTIFGPMFFIYVNAGSPTGRFGHDITAELQNVPADVTQDSIATYIRFTAVSTNMSSDRVIAYHHVAAKISDDVADFDSANLNAFISSVMDSCGNAGGTIPDSCYTTMIQNLGLRFFRRPLTGDQVANVKAAMGNGTLQSQISLIVYYMMLAPDFVYHMEADGSVTNNILTLDSYAVASRLSYLLMGTMPDTELFNRAAANQLSSSAGVKSAVDYIRATYDQKVRDRFWQFVTEWLKVPSDAIQGTAKVAALAAPNFDSSSYDAVRANMNVELRSMFEYYVFDAPGTYKSLFTSHSSFAKDGVVPGLYGASTWSGTGTPSAQPTNERAGFLTSAALTTTGGETTNPFAMGGLIYKHVLCRTFGDIQPPLAQPALNPADDGHLLTTRERFEKLVPRGSSCIACHSSVEAFGMPLQDYDAFGRHRHGYERIFDATGALIGSKIVDTYQTPVIGGSSTLVRSGTDLVTKLANTDEPGICFAKQYFRFAESRLDNTRDTCIISRFANNVATGDMWTAIKTFVSDDWFLKRRLQ